MTFDPQAARALAGEMRELHQKRMSARSTNGYVTTALKMWQHAGAHYATIADLLIAAADKLNRLHDYGIGTRKRGDGDSDALWGRIDAFRGGKGKLPLDDVKELAEWWAELHTVVAELDEQLACKREE